MKYANSLKTMNGFDSAAKAADISQKRARELCERMGRVHTGTRCICIPKGSASYACSLMLEAVIKSAGHRVGRLTSAADFDPRASIYVDGAIPSIDDFNTAVGELRSASKGEETYLKEEAVFALAMLLFKLCDCDYVILQGLSDHQFSLDAICAPYELIVMPTVYDDSERTLARLKAACDSVRRGTREVVSGNQKSEIYNQISNACAMSGVRLYIPVKAQFEVTEITPRRLRFSYGGKEGYCLRSPSIVLQNAAMTVIESAHALRRGGVKIPFGSIVEGLESVSNTGAFDPISASPVFVTDFARNRHESELLLETADAVWGRVERLCLLMGGDADPDDILQAFADRELVRAVAVGKSASSDQVRRFENSDEAVAYLLDAEDDLPILCLGGVVFAAEVKEAFMKYMNG